MENSWEKFTELPHVPNAIRARTERRLRQRQVRYLLFRLQTAELNNQDLETSGEYPPGFISFWLSEYPKYAIGPKSEKIPVPQNKNKPVSQLGGYSQFAKRWDVDADLWVYIRHSSIWQDWNAKMLQVVPILGE